MRIQAGLTPHRRRNHSPGSMDWIRASTPQLESARRRRRKVREISSVPSLRSDGLQPSIVNLRRDVLGKSPLPQKRDRAARNFFAQIVKSRLDETFESSIWNRGSAMLSLPERQLRG